MEFRISTAVVGNTVEITLPKGLRLSRRAMQDLAKATWISAHEEYELMDFVKAMNALDATHDRTLITTRIYQITRHDTTKDLFQKQPDGSYAMTLESLAAQRGRK